MKLAAINEMFELMFGEALLNEGEQITEKAPPNAEIEKWLEKPETKAEFKKRYGDDWEKVMYATAWKMHNDKNKDEEWNIDEELDEEWIYPQPGVDELHELHPCLQRLYCRAKHVYGSRDRDLRERR